MFFFDCNRFKYDSCINTGWWLKREKKGRKRKTLFLKESHGLVVTLNLVPCNTKKYELSNFVHVDIGVTVCIQIRKSSRFNFLILSIFLSDLDIHLFLSSSNISWLHERNKQNEAQQLGVYNSLEFYLYFPWGFPTHWFSIF